MGFIFLVMQISACQTSNTTIDILALLTVVFEVLSKAEDFHESYMVNVLLVKGIFNSF